MTLSSEQEKIYVLYHSNCYDGFGAAYAAWKKLGDDATYIPVRYGDAPPDMPDATKIYIVDFSYPPEVLLNLVTSKRHISVFVIDHHKTAQEKLSPMIGKYSGLYITFDMNKSGALLTWEHFFPEEPAAKLIQHISDRDIWKFELDGSKEIHAALVSYPFDFKVWDSFDVEKLKQEGITCERFQGSVVDEIVKSAWISKVDDYDVPVVNTTQSWSEVGEALLAKFTEYPFAASFTVFKDQIMWSLRSRTNFDVSAIAKKYGGGGHAQAAGFKAVRP